MNEATRAALLGSIAKWEAIVDGTGHDHGEDDCPLCKLFLRTSAKACVECPVRNSVGGGPHCSGTPYIQWSTHQIMAHAIYTGARRPRCVKCKRLATLELEFLRSLLPPPGISTMTNPTAGRTP